MEIEEEFISGFCRTCNGGQTVCCEYTMEGDKRTKMQATIYSLLFTNIFIYSSVFCCILQQTDL